MVQAGAISVNLKGNQHFISSWSVDTSKKSGMKFQDFWKSDAVGLVIRWNKPSRIGGRLEITMDSKLLPLLVIWGVWIA
jgi:hypothetical protein